MNETVKAALLAERRDAITSLTNRDRELAEAQKRLAGKEREQAAALRRLDDVSAFLREQGVDLAAVDAEAARRPEATQMLSETLGQSLSTLSALNQYDPTVGLVRALDEA